MSINFIQPKNTIQFDIKDQIVLTIAEYGFYVRDVKVEQDENEAKIVYDAFVKFLNNVNQG